MTIPMTEHQLKENRLGHTWNQKFQKQQQIRECLLIHNYDTLCCDINCVLIKTFQYRKREQEWLLFWNIHSHKHLNMIVLIETMSITVHRPEKSKNFINKIIFIVLQGWWIKSVHTHDFAFYWMSSKASFYFEDERYILKSYDNEKKKPKIASLNRRAHLLGVKQPFDL